MSFVSSQFLEVKAQLDKVIKSTNRQVDRVKLVAISKFFPAENIAEVYQLGQRAFGESKATELVAKATTLPQDIEWHFIGHLQSNKVKSVVEYASYIHSIDTIKLLERVNRLAGEVGKKPKVLLEVNVSGEESKYGFTVAQVAEAVAQAKSLPHIECVGLMTMAPDGVDSEELKKIFSTLKSLADQAELSELSMGMSGDYPEAVECGATLVRIGSAIFGNRSY